MTDRIKDPRDRVEYRSGLPGGRKLVPRAGVDEQVRSGKWVFKRELESWMTAAQRVEVLDFIAQLFLSGAASDWHVIEERTDVRSSVVFARNPRVIITVDYKSGVSREVGIEFTKLDLLTVQTFRAHLDMAGNSLNQQQ